MSQPTLPYNHAQKGRIEKIVSGVLIGIAYGLLLSRYHRHFYLMMIVYAMVTLPWLYMFFEKRRAWNFFPPLKEEGANTLGNVNIVVITFIAILSRFPFIIEDEGVGVVGGGLLIYLVFSYFMYFAFLFVENARNWKLALFLILDFVICAIFLFGNLYIQQIINEG